MSLEFDKTGLEGAVVLGWAHYNPNTLAPFRERNPAEYQLALAARHRGHTAISAYLAEAASELTLMPLDVTVGEKLIGRLGSWCVVLWRARQGELDRADSANIFWDLQTRIEQ